MPKKRLVEGTFIALEQALLVDSEAFRRTSPLRPRMVVSPNRLLSQHLPRMLASAGCPHANMHFLSMAGLAERLAARTISRARLTPLPAFHSSLVVQRTAQRYGNRLRYFRPVADMRRFHDAIAATCMELKLAGMEPKDLTRAMHALAPEHAAGVLFDKLADLALLWSRIEDSRAAHRFYDEADLLHMAAHAVGQGPWLDALSHLHIYGFYDLTEAQARLIAAAFGRADTTVYLPWCDTPAFRYARPVREWFIRQGFVPERAPEQDAAIPGDLARLQGSTGIEAMQDEPPPPPHEGVRVISAPGEVREVEEIVREVLHFPDAGRHTIGIILRDGDGYRGLLRDALEVSGIAGYFHGGLSLSRQPAGRALLLLARLLRSPLRRADVMDFIRAAPLRPLPEGDEAPVEQWNHFTIEAGIVEGRAEWESRLDALAERYALVPARYEPEIEACRTHIAAIPALNALREFLRHLFDGLERVASLTSWTALAHAMAKLYRDLVEDTPDARAVAERIEGAALLDAMDVPATVEQFVAVIAESIETTGRSVDDFQRREPTIGSLMEMRGAPFDIVVLPGLVEGAFPQPARQDPILLDADRLALAKALAQRERTVTLPLKRRRREEEELLFTLAVQSARRRLVLTWPRVDRAGGPRRAPSPFLLRAVETLRGGTLEGGALKDFFLTDPRARHGRASRLDSFPKEQASTSLEYDLAAMGEAVRNGTPEAMLYITEETPFFEQALRAEKARWELPQFTPYDGVARSRSLLRALRGLLHDERRIVSATRLEHYARCPFSYMLRYVLNIEAVEEPERVISLLPVDRGALAHSILWEFMSAAAHRGRPVTEALWPELETVARRHLAEFARRGATGYPLMWRIETDRLLHDLRLFLRYEAGDAGRFQPAYFEVRFGMGPTGAEESEVSSSAPAVLPLRHGRAARFCGRIDRIDVDPARALCRIIDYKTGRGSYRQRDNTFDGGRLLQLPVYLLAAPVVLKGLHPLYAEYFFISERGGWRRVRFSTERWEKTLRTLSRIVDTILTNIRRGRFFPRGDASACAWCEFRTVCGHAGALGEKWRTDAATTASFRRMAAIP